MAVPLSREEDRWVEGLLAAFEENGKSLSDWARGFMNDQRERYEKYGKDISLSAKQWNVLYRAADDLGYARPGNQEQED